MLNFEKIKNSTLHEKINALVLILVLIIACVVPLIVKMVPVERAAIEVEILGLPENAVDAFSIVKSNVIVFCTVIIVLLRGYEMLHVLANAKTLKIKEKLLTPLNIITAIYLFAVLLSSIFSEYMEVVLAGHAERHESVFILFAYMILMLNVIACVKQKIHMRIVIYGLYFTAIGVGIIGFFQYIDRDPFNTEFGQRIIMGKYADVITNFQIIFPTVYSTLFNPNNAGLYASLLLPFTIVLALLLPYRDILKYISILVLPLLVIIALGSYSLGGMIGSVFGVFMAVVISVIYYFSNKKVISDKRKFTLRLAYGLAAFAVVLLAVFNIPFFRSRFDNMMNKASVSFAIQRDENLLYRNMYIDNNSLNIETRYGAFSITYNMETNMLEVYNADGNIEEPVLSEQEQENLFIYEYKLSDGNSFNIRRSGNAFLYALQGQFLFQIEDTGNLQALTPFVRPIDINTPIRSIGFEDHQLLGNSRGFIWSRTFPILFDHIIIGSGPDTYAFEFPQNDIVGKSNALRDPNMIVDKPHNMYMQQAVNTGFISLIALCTIFVMYLYGSIIICMKNKISDPFTIALCIAIFSGICGYLLGSMTTDSTVSVSPVFWCMLGLGFAVNIYIKEQSTNETNL